MLHDEFYTYVHHLLSPRWAVTKKSQSNIPRGISDGRVWCLLPVDVCACGMSRLDNGDDPSHSLFLVPFVEFGGWLFKCPLAHVGANKPLGRKGRLPSTMTGPLAHVREKSVLSIIFLLKLALMVEDSRASFFPSCSLSPASFSSSLACFPHPFE